VSKTQTTLGLSQRGLELIRGDPQGQRHAHMPAISLVFPFCPA
jgi:hypothetical protein